MAGGEWGWVRWVKGVRERGRSVRVGRGCEGDGWFGSEDGLCT